MRYLDIDGIGRVSRIGLGTWQFGSREWGYGEDYASGSAGQIVRATDVTLNESQLAVRVRREMEATLGGRASSPATSGEPLQR